MSNVGKKIKELRMQAGLSADELAKKIGKNRATVFRYESGYIESLPLEVLEPIAKALNVSPGVLMGWEDNSNKEKKIYAVPASTKTSDDYEKAMILYEKYKNALPQVQEIVENLLKSSRPDS